MKSKSLLIVDDEPAILDYLSRDLVCVGFEVTLTSSGQEAIAKINTGLFDLVTTDLLMPGVDGFQVLKAAKQKSPQLMVIILTGYGTEDSAIDALRLGADAG
jgi:DNA-binding NtrC family response regulator